MFLYALNKIYIFIDVEFKMLDFVGETFKVGYFCKLISLVNNTFNVINERKKLPYRFDTFED